MRGMRAVTFVALTAMLATSAGANSFVNFETPQVHPVDLSPDGAVLAVCNTADNRIEFFHFVGDEGPTFVPQPWISIPVGMDPVSVRFRNDNEVWAVNHLSDSVSIIDLVAKNVVQTVGTDDEPCDVVFAGAPQRAFVSLSQVNKVLVLNPEDPGSAVATLSIDAEDPRAMAVSPDGSKVYVAIFESGNKTTILGGGSTEDGVITFPPNVVDDIGTPHAGQNPAFNADGGFDPPKNPANGPAPEVGLIVRQGADGRWRDDTGADWTNHVSGPNATQSGRPEGWTLLDHDVAVINANSLGITYVDGLMNANMAIAVNPANGKASVIGTDAINEVRFEPKVNSIFVRVVLASADPANPQTVDANPHLDYNVRQIPQNEREKSLGDPRGIVWNSTGTKAYITGMGSNNLIVVDSAGNRVGLAPTIDLREGPTGLAIDEARGVLYVLNRFDASISVVDLTVETEVAHVRFYDPTPPPIKIGRKHLYDTHKTSGLGQSSCGSCHLDARMDRLSWDLGDPPGTPKGLAELNLGANIPGLNDGFQPFHPMKGPMSTQTLQGIIGQEPFHWRGDRLGIEEFNPAFMGLLGDDVMLTPQEMREFKDFLASIHFPPNPFRNLDNSLPTDLDLSGHYTTGRFSPAGDPLPNGNAVRGLALYMDINRPLDQGAFSCVMCHTLPSGNGTDSTFNGATMVPIPPNPETGNHHLALVSVDGSTNRTIKVAQLRNLYDKVGFNMVKTVSRSGFGFMHDGGVDTLERFLSEGAFDVSSDQEVADLTALMLAFSGSDFQKPNPLPLPFDPPGAPSRDAHAAVGQQETVAGPTKSLAFLDTLLTLAEESDRVQVIAKGRQGEDIRGWLYLEDGRFQRDEADETLTKSELLALAGPGKEITFTAVPEGTGTRLALDRDEDGKYDYNEILDGTDPTDPTDGGGGGPAIEVSEVIPREILRDTQADITFRGIFRTLTALTIAQANQIYRVYFGDPPYTVQKAAAFREESDGSGVAITPYDGTNRNSMHLRTPRLDRLGGVPIAVFTLADSQNPLVIPPDPAFFKVVQEGDDYHSADTNRDWRINLSELMRIIQFYNSGRFHCQPGTEDGYAPGIGAQNCAPHDSDYSTQDWTISLSELLRLVQFFNMKAYHPCEEGEDGFCPGI